MPTPDAIISGVRDELLRYYDTAYRLADRGLMAERSALLRRQGIVFGEPFIELLPQYPLAGDHDGTVRTPAGSLELAGAPPILAELIEEVMLDGVPRPRRLFAHQEEALAASFGRNEHVALTSGTGSGKTEAFLLPILSRLTAEAQGWAGAPQDAEGGRWWAHGPRRIPQRNPAGHRPAAVRALVLFPMNALVEDQLVRLRRYLDGDTARSWFDRHLGGNRFYFGQYTGRTPVAGKKDEKPYKRQELRDQLRRAEREWLAVERLLASDTDGRVDRDARFVIPRVDAAGSAEMRSRWDMQDAPPGHPHHELLDAEHHARPRRGVRDLGEDRGVARPADRASSRSSSTSCTCTEEPREPRSPTSSGGSCESSGCTRTRTSCG